MVIGLAVGAVVLAAGGAVTYQRVRSTCGDAVQSRSAARSSSPFLDAGGRAQQPDHDRDALVRTLSGDPAPVGEVLGAAGYHYEQWAQISAYAQGIGVRTRDNPDFTMLSDATLRPLWSVQVHTERSAYDASDRRYLVATMPRGAAPDLVALDASTGRRVWCTSVGTRTVAQGAPFATAVLATDDVVALSPGGGHRMRVGRYAGQDGTQVWERTLDADSGDFLGPLDDHLLLTGGREQFRLFDPGSMARRPAGVALAAIAARDGHTVWTSKAPAGSDLHVLGTDPGSGTAVVAEWSTRTRAARITALDSAGHRRWSVLPARGAVFDATLRSGRILVRVGSRWSAYDISDGRRLWSKVFPDRPQFLPYGFELDSIPLLDAQHALIGGTTALHTLDLDTGTITSAALPTNGINTTYWPYQLAVSSRLIAVATNTGAVVVRRE